MSRVIQRVIALQEARDRANDPVFKLLWEMKRKELVKLAERGEIGKYDTGRSWKT